ncbi:MULTISPECIES: cellulose biosynthesis protein BcsQ [Pseudomonas]|uniref:Cellulose synthase operon protein YhjQ n=1 Tax=Pseudomonas poae TaxID=200451 RepID=A0A7M1KGG6_9PSED|nr:MULTISPECIES: cellulose biosynthesis protein BcsQ [Pseudomonas]QHD04530.1 cellulose synthase operon protein YhjQ [Pseudomonas sp. R76]QOQ74209.1 cellulose synthase operon protein YhjQ [Pseudomonas poae]
MSLSEELLALFGKNVTHDAQGINARMHFFGSVPADENTHPQSQLTDIPALRPKVVALVSMNGGVGRSTLATALSSGLQRHGESVVALDLDPQNALHHHFGVSAALPGIGRTSLEHGQWSPLQQLGFAGCQVITFGDIDIQQQENLERWLKHEPTWLAQRLASLGLSERQTVIIDTPAGNNVYFHQALNVADVVLVIVQADAACLGTLDHLDVLLAPHLEGQNPPAVQVVVNQVDESNPFSLDMVEAFKQRLGKAPLEVHRDMAINEALAFAADPLDNVAKRLASDDINEICRVLKAPKATA